MAKELNIEIRMNVPVSLIMSLWEVYPDLKKEKCAVTLRIGVQRLIIEKDAREAVVEEIINLAKPKEP